MKDPEYSRKLDAAFTEMKARNVPLPRSLELQIRCLCRVGFEPIPVFYAGYWSNALKLGSAFGLGWGVFMHFFYWEPAHFPGWIQVPAAMVAGTLFGLVMAGYYRRIAVLKKLSNWAEL